MTAQANPAPESVALSRTERREYIVGVCTALALAAILAFTVMANRSSDSTATAGFTLTAAFHKADGIHAGSPVRVAGMNIGTVAAVGLDAERKAVLTLNMNAPIDLPTDTAAVIETDGLFGTKYIELRPGGEEEIFKSGGRMTYTQDSVILEDLVGLIVQRAKDARAKSASETASPSEVQQ